MSSPSSTHIKIPAAGIDIGFFSTKYTCGTRATPTGSEIITAQFPSLAPTPSLQAYDSHAYKGFLVNVDGVQHFVGKDVYSFMDATGQLRAATEDYSQTPAYKALFLGALAHIAQHHHASGSLTIKTLTMGLPLLTVRSHGRGVINMATGTHLIPSPVDPTQTIKVVVNQVLILGQPQGALIRHCQQLSTEMNTVNALILDMGGGTFDWFLSERLIPNFMLSGAIPRGMLACVEAVANQIDPKFRSEPRVMERIDTAMRENAPTVKIMGEAIPLAPHLTLADKLVQDSINQMLTRMGSLGHIDHVLLTGGGAQMLMRGLEQNLPKLMPIVHVDSDPVTSNVKGFHLFSIEAGSDS